MSTPDTQPTPSSPELGEDQPEPPPITETLLLDHIQYIEALWSQHMNLLRDRPQDHETEAEKATEQREMVRDDLKQAYARLQELDNRLRTQAAPTISTEIKSLWAEEVSFACKQLDNVLK